jgi:hypothetical protein
MPNRYLEKAKKEIYKWNAPSTHPQPPALGPLPSAPCMRHYEMMMPINTHFPPAPSKPRTREGVSDGSQELSSEVAVKDEGGGRRSLSGSLSLSARKDSCS